MSVDCKTLSQQGLLSELIQVDVKFQSKLDDDSIPSTFVVKFSPQATKTLILINLFKFGQTEFCIYKKLAPYFPCRVPRMWAGDMNFTSGRQCMMLDKIEADFIAITEFDRITVEHVEKLLDLLAIVHAAFWGDRLKKPGLNWLISVDHVASAEISKIVSKEAKKGWDTFVERANDPSFPVGEGTGFAKVEVSPAVIAAKDHFITCSDTGEGIGGWRTTLHNPDLGWVSFMHGDTRMDNFFFDDATWEEGGIPGMIDLQMSGIGGIGKDVAYTLTTQSVFHRFPKEVDRLLHRYFEKLQSLGGAPNKQFDEFEEHVALGAAECFVGAVIGAATVDVEGAQNPQQVLEVVHILCSGALLAMEHLNSVDAINRVAAKTAICQTRKVVQTFEDEP